MWIKTYPGEENYHLFSDVPKYLYPEGSLRFVYGNEPVEHHLVGCYVYYSDQKPLGRFALYFNEELSFKNLKTLCIGSYECIDDQHVANIILERAKNEAKFSGGEYLLGPMEGSTWNNYRFSTDHKGRNFFMEPYHHLYYNDQFKKAGFIEIAHYVSNLINPISFDAERLEKLDKRFKEQGAIIRHIDVDHLENELDKIAQFSNEAFKENFLFSPIDPSLFVKKYGKLKEYFVPEFIWMIEDAQGELHALMFALHDYCDASNETVIIKTVARKENSPYRGVGTYLVDKLIAKAMQRGYKKAIHAFMLETNDSMVISARYNHKGQKSYSLYGIEL